MTTDNATSAGWREHPRYPDPAIETLDPRFELYRISARRWNGSTRAAAGLRGRFGLAMAAIYYGAIFPTTAS